MRAPEPLGTCCKLYASGGADYVLLTLPTQQAGETDESQEAPLKAVIVAIRRGGLIDGLGERRRGNAAGQ